MSLWEDCYRQHFAKYLGKPFDMRRFPGPDGFSLKIATYDQPYPGYLVYATLGLADLVDQVRDLGEVVLVADDRGDDILQIYLHALFFLIEKRIALGSRCAIGGVDQLAPDFAEQFQKSALFFTAARGFPEGFESVEGWEETGAVYEAIFLSQAEHAFFQREGHAALEECLRVQDDSSLRRPSCV